MNFSAKSVLGFSRGANAFRARVSVHDGVVLLRVDGRRRVADVVEGAALPENEANDVLRRHLDAGFLVVVEEGEGLGPGPGPGPRDAEPTPGPGPIPETSTFTEEEARISVELPDALAERIWEEKPRVKEGLDITTRDLSVMQGFLVSRIDGATRVREVAQLCGVGRDRALAMVTALALDGVVVLAPAIDREIRVVAGDIEPADELAAFAEPEAIEADDELSRMEVARTWRIVKPDGDLRGTPFLAVLRFALGQKQTGVLRVENAAGRRDLFLQDGVVICAATNCVDDDIGLLLKQAGRLSDAAYDRYLSIVSRSTAGPVAALVEMGIVKQGEVALALRYRDEKVLERLVGGRESGTYQFLGRRRLPAGLSVTQPATSAVLFRVMMETTPEEVTRKFAASHLDHYFFAAKTPRTQVAALRLRKRDQQILDAITAAPGRLRDIYTLTSTNRLRTALYVQTFSELGVLDSSTTPPDALVKVLQPRKRLAEKIRRSAGRNHFDLLEIQEVASLGEIEDAYKRLKSEFGAVGVDEADRAAATRLNELFDEAYAVLSNDESRRAYREKVCGREQLERLADVEFQKGEDMLFFRKKYESAIACFETAREIAPWNAEILAMLGLARFKWAFPDPVEVPKAIKMIDDALTQAPNSARVLVCLAMVNAESGNKRLARQLLERASRGKMPPAVAELIASLQGRF